MKIKLLIILLIITSLIGFLEWGENNKSFLFEAEYEVIKQMFINPKNLVHPFVLLPLLGQILLLISCFLKKPSKIFIYIGIASLGLLLGFMFFIGILSMNYRILISTLPFLLVSTLTIIHLRKQYKLNRVTKKT